MRVTHSILAAVMLLVPMAWQTQAAILFGIQKANIVAEQLPYGPVALTESSSAFLSTLVASTSHNVWTQIAKDGIGNQLFQIRWDFASTKTVAQRFQDAVTVGEPVTWTVNGTDVFIGTWRFSNSAGDMTTRFNGTSSAPFFSNDDGVWGAGNGIINGNGTNALQMAWGYANYDGADTFAASINSGSLRLGNVTQASLPSGFTNYMYVGDLSSSSVPEPSTFALLGLGAIGLAIRNRRRRSAEQATLGTSLPNAFRQLPVARSRRKNIMLPVTCLASVTALVMSLQGRVDAALIDGLVAYYNFNQSSGSSLPLVAGTGNNGVLNNMDNSDWVAGQTNFGNALDFDGNNDFVHIADGYTNTVSGDNTHTVSMWFKQRPYSTDQIILDSEDGGDKYYIQFNTGLKAYYQVGGSYRVYTGTAPTIDTWHQIVLTKTGMGDSGDLYLDGAKLISFTGNLASTPVLTSDFLLGKYKQVDLNFGGLIDDLAFWNRNLSDAEVATLFSAGTELAQLIATVPEPSTFALLGLGAIGLAIRSRRSRTAN